MPNMSYLDVGFTMLYLNMPFFRACNLVFFPLSIGAFDSCQNIFDFSILIVAFASKAIYLVICHILAGNIHVFI